MIYETVTLSTFQERFETVRPDSFSRKALEIIFNRLEDLSNEQDEKIELDIVDICTNYSEINIFNYHKEVIDDIDKDDFESEGCFDETAYNDALDEAAKEWINSNLEVIDWVDDETVVIQE